MARRKLTDEQEAELVAAYKAGERTPVLCERYGISNNCVIDTMRRHGVPTRGRGRPPTKGTQQLSDVYALTGGSWQPDPKRPGVSVWVPS